MSILASLIFLLLFSCSPPCRRWEFSTVKAIYPCHTYAKVSLPPPNTFNGIEIEFLFAEGDAVIFLNVFTLVFPFSICNEATADVDLEIEGQTYRFASERLLGGQRIKLPEEAKLLLISALLENRPIAVTVGRYQATIVSDNFEKIYKRFSIASKY